MASLYSARVKNKHKKARANNSKYQEIDKRETVKRWFRELSNKVYFMPGRYYERDEDWMVTCPECHGRGTIGVGDSRKRCPKCDGTGKLRR